MKNNLKKNLVRASSIALLLITEYSAHASWTQVANYGGGAIYSAAGFSVGNKGYIGTGINNGVNRRDFWQYDPVTNAWTQVANFGGTARHGATAFSIGSKGYLGLGWVSSVTSDFWSYDPVTNTWTQLGNFPGGARYTAVSFVIGSKGYVGTGFNGNVLNDFWSYDSLTSNWAQVSAFSGGARQSAIGFSINNKGYVGCGYNSGSLFDFWEYNPSTNLWTQRTSFQGSARYAPAGFSLQGNGYVGNGYNGSSIFTDFWKYDVTTNTWSAFTSYPGTPSYANACFVIDTVAYVGTGGLPYPSVTNEIWSLTDGTPCMPVAIISAAGPTSFCSDSVILNANTGTGLSYQWRLNGGNISGATAASYSATATGTYDCIVSNSCSSSTSNIISVNANAPPAASIIASGPTTLCITSLPLILSANTGIGLSYQWRFNGNNIIGETTSTYIIGTLNYGSGNYDCIVTNSCSSTASNSITVIINSFPQIFIWAQGLPTTVCSPNGVLLMISSISGGGPYYYQWQRNSVNIPAAVSNMYLATTTGNYTCTVYNACPGIVSSNSISVTVNSIPAANITAPGGSTVCSPNTVTLNANTGSGISYQWRLNGGNISGATASTYATGVAGNYDCVETNSCGSATSNIISVTVNTLPPASVTAAGATTFCAPGSVTLYANTGAGLSWQWKLNGINISGATASSYSASATGNYDCIVTNSCGSTTSNSISVTVNPLPTATITAAGPTTFCSPGSVTLNANTGTGLSWQWKLNGVNISGATASSYVANTSGSYTCVVTNSCGSASSNAIAVTVNVLPATPGAITGQTAGVCNSAKTYSINPVAGATGYTWTVPANSSISSGQGTTSVNVAFTSAFSSGNISVVATNSCGSSGASSVTTTGVPAQPGTITGPASVCANQNNVIYSIAAVTGATSYTWTVPPGTQIKTGQGTVQIKVRFGNSAGSITVKANNACGSGPIRTLAIAMPCREVEEFSVSEFSVNVFPNPSSNDFTFEISASRNNSVSINIFDLTGRIVERHQNISGGNEFKCGTNLIDGIYYAEIISGDKKEIRKLIKQR